MTCAACFVDVFNCLALSETLVCIFQLQQLFECLLLCFRKLRSEMMETTLACTDSCVCCTEVTENLHVVKSIADSVQKRQKTCML